VELLEQAVKIQGLTLAKNHPDQLASQHQLAKAYMAKGQVTEAVELLQHVWRSNDPNSTRVIPVEIYQRNYFPPGCKRHDLISKRAHEVLPRDSTKDFDFEMRGLFQRKHN
jgi:hypothetical protein